MDASLTGGLPVTVIGIVTVFAALLALIGVIRLITRMLIEKPAQPAAPPLAAASTEATEQTDTTDPEPNATTDLLPIALAAYGLHLQIRGRAGSKPAAAGSNQWALAGRVQQQTRLTR